MLWTEETVTYDGRYAKAVDAHCAPDEADAPEALAKAARIYGPLAATIEEHGIWGSPARVIEGIQRHVALGCTHFVMELFGRDPRQPARLFADHVLPAFRWDGSMTYPQVKPQEAPTATR